jgi:hypothetical protein
MRDGKGRRGDRLGRERGIRKKSINRRREEYSIRYNIIIVYV